MSFRKSLSLPRDVYFILAAHRCNGWSGAACQVPLAQAEKIIPKTCYVPDVFCRMSKSDREGKRQEVWVGVSKKARGGELPHTNPRVVTFVEYVGTGK